MRETLSTKKTLIITAAIGIALVGALLVYGIMVTPARQPYRDALTQYENTNNALSRTSVSVNSSTANDEEFTKNIQAVQATLVSLGKENEALAKEAVLTTGEGRKLYDAYSKDLQKYITYNSDVLTSMQKVRPVFHKCSGAMDSVSANAEGGVVMKTCAADMQAAIDVPDADYKQLAKSFQENYAQLASIFEQMNAVTDQSSAEYQSLTQQRDAVVENFSEASSAFSKSVQQHRKEILSTRSAHDLKHYLEEKSRIF